MSHHSFSQKKQTMCSFIVIALVLAVSVASTFTPSVLTQQMLHPEGIAPAKPTSSPSNSTDSKQFIPNVTLSLRILRTVLRGYEVRLYSFIIAVNTSDDTVSCC